MFPDRHLVLQKDPKQEGAYLGPVYRAPRNAGRRARGVSIKRPTAAHSRTVVD